MMYMYAQDAFVCICWFKIHSSYPYCMKYIAHLIWIGLRVLFRESLDAFN